MSIRRACFSIFALGLTLTLCACSQANSHEILTSQETCSDCHSDEKPVYSATSSDTALICDTRVTVETEESHVVLCEPLFINEEASSFVPKELKRYPVQDGQVVISGLDSGLWALCVDYGDSSKGVLINVEVGSSYQASVML